MKKQVIFDPIVNPKAVVSSGKVRFSILTDRIIRMEFDPAANFDDKPSLVYWYRNFDAPEFHVSSSDDQIIIEFMEDTPQVYPYKFRLHAMDGKLMQSVDITSPYGNALRIPVSGILPGCYIVSLQDKVSAPLSERLCIPIR